MKNRHLRNGTTSNKLRQIETIMLNKLRWCHKSYQQVKAYIAHRFPHGSGTGAPLCNVASVVCEVSQSILQVERIPRELHNALISNSHEHFVGYCASVRR